MYGQGLCTISNPKLTGIIVESLSVHQILKYVTLLLEALRFAEHRDQLLYLGVGKVRLAR